MERRFAVLDEGAKPRIYKVPVNQTARLVNEFPFRKVEIFESFSEAKEAALAIAGRARAAGKHKNSLFATRPTAADEELRNRLSELTEERVETYYF
ncbi:MAG: hypothetical protein V3S27_07870 [Kiloniellales bacterium]